MACDAPSLGRAKCDVLVTGDKDLLDAATHVSDLNR